MYSFQSRVRYSEVDSNRQITWTSILDLFQDCCTFQSEEVGNGLDYMMKHQKAWVLSSWQVDVLRYPSFHEKITICTWPYEMKGFMGRRNFVIKDSQDEMILQADSLWIYMDIEKGVPARIPDEIGEMYGGMEERLPMEAWNRKLKIEGEFVAKDPVKVHPFLIDTNQHVNNSKYVMLAEEFVPKEFQVSKLRVEYKKSAVLGEVMYPKVQNDTGKVTVVFEQENGKPYAIVEFLQ